MSKTQLENGQNSATFKGPGILVNKHLYSKLCRRAQVSDGERCDPEKVAGPAAEEPGSTSLVASPFGGGGG